MYMEENGVMGQSMRINNARKLSLRAEQRGQRSLATTLTSERRLLFFFSLCFFHAVAIRG
jgi:hypothetical protein